MDCVVELDARPKPGETIMGRSVSLFPGGKGANQAVAAARLGGEVLMAGCVGKDIFGSDLKAFLKDQNIALALSHSEEKATGFADIQLTNDGENSIVVISGANSEVDNACIDNALQQTNAENALFVAQNEIPLDTVIYFFERGKKSGALNIYNPAPMHEIDKAREAAGLANIIIVNEIEFQQLVGLEAQKEELSQSDIAELSKNLLSDTQSLIVTLGARGFVVLSAEEDSFHGEACVVDIVDTTGAGDCFVGALSAALSNGSNLREAAIFANQAAAIAVTRLGAGIGMPFTKDVI